MTSPDVDQPIAYRDARPGDHRRRRSTKIVPALVLVGMLGSASRADVVVSVPVFALSSRAIAIEGELPIAPHVSLGAAGGVRDPASGDFGGYALAVGPAVRYWRRDTQRGLHGVARIEASVINLQRAGKDLGTAFGLAPSVGVGYRFVIRDRVTITPDAGLGSQLDFGHRGIPTHRRWTSFLGLSIGGRW